MSPPSKPHNGKISSFFAPKSWISSKQAKIFDSVGAEDNLSKVGLVCNCVVHEYRAGAKNPFAFFLEIFEEIWSQETLKELQYLVEVEEYMEKKKKEVELWLGVGPSEIWGIQHFFVSLLLPIYLGKVKLRINKEVSKTVSRILWSVTIFEHDMLEK